MPQAAPPAIATGIVKWFNDGAAAARADAEKRAAQKRREGYRDAADASVDDA